MRYAARAEPNTMAKPTIIAVDDDPQVVAAIRRDLNEHYRADYRVAVADGGAAALEVVRELAGRDNEVALFLADQRMPEMTGTEFLVEATALFPEAKSVLLTAYADTNAAIEAINVVGLDHYLMKPWDPPDDRLYPVLDDLLEDWAADRRPSFEGIRVVGTRWSPDSHDVKDFLSRNQIPYLFLDVDYDSEARRLLDTVADPTLPVIFFPDAEPMIHPDRRALAERVGLHTEATAPFYDVIVIGAGPAGLAASVYGASEGLRVATIERQAIGGQAGMSSRIENYLGFPKGISGGDLARRAAAQAQRLGAEILTTAEVSGVRVEGPARLVTLADGSELSCRALVIASGMTVRHLSVPGYERLNGAGVYYGATVAEAATYRDEDVFVIGGANSAGQAAMMFSRFAKSVTMVVRGESLDLKMSQYLIDQIGATPNIEVRCSTRVAEVRGEEKLEQVVLEDRTDGTEEVRDAAALFIFVGAVPHTDFVREVVELNEHGFVITGPDLLVDGKPPKGWPLERDPYLMETSVPGIFAAGDVRHGVVRRVASAVGQGSVCISFVHQYLDSA
jgi:thioredoxin reductase (NADPH)